MAQAIRRSARERRPGRPFLWTLIVAIVVVALTAAGISILQQTVRPSITRPTVQPTPVAQATPSAQPTAIQTPRVYVSQDVRLQPFYSGTIPLCGLRVSPGTTFYAPFNGHIVVQNYAGGYTINLYDDVPHALVFVTGHKDVDAKLLVTDGQNVAQGDALFTTTSAGVSAQAKYTTPFQVVVAYTLKAAPDPSTIPLARYDPAPFFTNSGASCLPS